MDDPRPSDLKPSLSAPEGTTTPVIMEERSSSFVEMAPPLHAQQEQQQQPPPPPQQLRQRSSSKRSAASRSQSQSQSRQPLRDSAVSRPSHATVYNETDANEMILRANAPPNYSGGFDAIMKQIKAKKYYTEQFQRIQMQTEMGTFLYFSDVAPTNYESNYLSIAQHSSVLRVRICCALGMLSLGLFYASEWYKGTWNADAKVGRTDDDKTVIIALTFGVIVPTFALGLLSTFTAWGRRNLENITVVVFTVVAAVMIAKKPIEKVKGPVIPLLILLIPIFGITRMRFVKSCCIGWGIFFTYLISMSVARTKVPKPDSFDSYTDISYQTINYGISVIGGMVSQYRQELLRRRNFCLQLPFSGTMDSDAIDEIKADKFKKSRLMHRWSQRFRNPEVEECFYRYWYLIDPFPYENPNSGSLHQGVFRTIRFAIYTLLLNQFVLLLQDIKFLKVKKDANVEPSDFTYAVTLRFGVTVPLYLSAALFMYFVGKAFYAKWVKEAEDAKNAALARTSQVEMEIEEAHHKQPAGLPADAQDTEGGLRMKLVVEAAIVKEKTKDRVVEVLLNKGGYVRSTQVFSSVVIACHVACMGIILLAVSTGSSGQKGGKPKPVYYMGFLNAVLFAHRSGFRVRFIYATYTTFVVALGVIIAASSLSPDYYLEYAGFVTVIFALSMMISYEEENLRRSFFVLKSIRTLEFEEWFSVVLRLQGWVRERFRRKLQEVRAKGVQKAPESADDDKKKKKKKKAEPPLVNTSAQMAQASKFGMYSQMGNIVIALIDVLTAT
ncbi:hypothetical protein P43SY_008409 [Pythium insidiosum]|uniref:Transmembrane protein n=1 Tax=Pythium insidiosum TaxID=114742 RepID=A0AAD5Q685_PYTIN|nr:hypothetical protein P43SY_008409 [Pythium insidiosum]